MNAARRPSRGIISLATLIYLGCVGSFAAPPAVDALPSGMTVLPGTTPGVSVSATVNGNTMTINAGHEFPILQTIRTQWQSFDVGSQATVNINNLRPSFTQHENGTKYWNPTQGWVPVPNPTVKSDVFMVSVSGTSPTQIFGRINAPDYNLVLLNQNGVVFGPGARVDAGGIIASSLAIDQFERFEDSTAAFFALDFSGQSQALVRNEGVLSGRYVALVGLNVEQAGQVGVTRDAALVAGDAARLVINALAHGDQEGKLSVTLRPGSRPLASIAQQGQIQAGENVFLMADVAEQVLQDAIAGQPAARQVVVRDGRLQLITVAGTVQAPSINSDVGANGQMEVTVGMTATKQMTHGGSLDVKTGASLESPSISVKTAPGGTISVAGTIQATPLANGIGGSIELLGDNVVIRNGALLDASGRSGGGSIQIGGSWQYPAGGLVRQTLSSVVEAGAVVRANALLVSHPPISLVGSVESGSASVFFPATYGWNTATYPVQLTGVSTTKGSTFVTTGTGGLFVGMGIRGGFIPEGASIASIVGNDGIVLTVPATGSAPNLELYAGGTSGFAVGMNLTGTNIPAGAIITAITSPTSLTLSAVATGTGLTTVNGTGATGIGNGGTIVVTSDITNPASLTVARGRFEAKSGVKSGFGGHIETSGYSVDFKDGVYLNEGVRTFSATPSIDRFGPVPSVSGGNGTWLIDRTADTVSPAEVSFVAAATGWSKVTLRHRSDVARGVLGDIILASPMSFTEGGQFVAQAERDIFLNSGLTGTGGKFGGYLKMSADRDIVFGPAGVLDSPASIVILSAGRDLRIGDQSAAAASFTAGPTKLSAGRDIHLNVLANTFEPGFPGLYMAGSSFSTPGAETFVYDGGWGNLIDVFDVDNFGVWRRENFYHDWRRPMDAWRSNLIDANISGGGGAIHLYSNLTSSWFTTFKDRLYVKSDATVYGLQNYFHGGIELGANLNIANRSAGGLFIGTGQNWTILADGSIRLGLVTTSTSLQSPNEVFLKGINMLNGDIAVGSHVLTFGGAVAGLPQFAQAPTSLVLFGENTDYRITAAPNGRVNFDNVGLIQPGIVIPLVDYYNSSSANRLEADGYILVNPAAWNSMPKNVNRLVVEAGGISLAARGVHIDTRFVVTGDSDPALTLPTNLDLADAEGFRFGQMTVFDRGFEVVDGGSSTADLDVRIGRKVIFSPGVSGSQVRIAGDVTVAQSELAFLGRANIPVDVTLSGTSLTLTGSALHLGAAREADQGTYRLPAITADAASSIHFATRQATYQFASANAIMGNVYVEDGLLQLPAGAASFFGTSASIYVRQGSLDLNGNEIAGTIILDASNFIRTTSPNPKIMNDLSVRSGTYSFPFNPVFTQKDVDVVVHYQEPGNPQPGNYGAVKQLFSSATGADGYVNLPKLRVLGDVTLTMPAGSPFLAFGELEVSTALTLGANASVAFTEQLAGLGANGIITVGSGLTTRILSSPTPSTGAGSFVLATGATMEVGALSLGAALQINNLGRLRLTAVGDIAAKDLVIGSGVASIEVPDGAALSFSSIRSASASSLNPFYLEKSGPGLLKLSNPATPDVGFYGLRVLGGRVALMTANTLSPGSPAFATAQVSSGASLELNGHANDSPFFSVNGSGVSGEGALVSSSPSPLTIGALRLAGHATVDLGGATSILNIDSGLYNIINSSGGPVTLTKLGAGVLTLNPRATPPTDVAYDLKGGGLAVGRLFGAARVDVRAGAMLDLSFDDPTTAMQSYGFPLSIAGSGPNGDGAIVNYSTSASSGSPETGIAGYLSLGSLSLAGDAKIRSDNRVFYSGVISDGGSGFGLTLSGAAATSQHVFNSAAHTFSGGLNVQSAQVYLRNGNLGTGSIVLGDGAMVNLIGRSISSSVSVVAGAAATLANTSSTESVLSGSLSLAAGSVLSIGGGDTSIGNNLPLGKFSITGSVSGAGTLRKVGISNVKLNGDNALFAGQLSVQQGRITLGHGSALGTSQVSIANGGALDLNGFSTTTHFTLASVSGDYFSSYSQAAPLVNYSATPAIISGDIDLGADSAIFSSADLTFNGVIRTGPHTLQLKGTGARQLNNPANSISSLAVSGPSSVSVKSAGRDLVITGSFGSGGLSAELLTAHQLRLGAGLVSTSSSGNVLLRSSGSASIISAHNAGAFKVTVFADGDIDVVGNVTSRSVVLASPTGRISLTGTFSSHEENVYVMAAKPGNVTRTILVNTSNSAGLGSDRTVMYNTAVTTFDQLDSKVAAANAAVWHRSYTLSTPTTGKGRYGFAFIYSNSPYVTVTPIVLGKSADFRDQNGDGIGAQNELAYTGTATAEHAYASTNFGLIHWLRSPSGDGIDVLTSASLSLTGTPTITATDSNGNPVSLSNRTPEIRVFQSGIFQSSLTDVRIFPALQDAGVYHIAVGVGAMSASVPGVSVIAAPPLVYEIKPILLTGAYMANYGLTKTVGIAREYDGLSDVPAAYLNGAEALRTPAEMATTAGISDSTLFSGLDISLLSATFADASEGDNKPITVRYSLTQNGLASKNFVVPPLTSTAFVSNGQTYSTPLVGTIYTGNLLILSDLSLASRTYDGSVSGGISLASWGDLLSLRDGTRNPAGVTLDTTNVSLVYAAPDASMTQPVPVSVTGLALAGPNAASYRILNQSASGLILPKTVAITATKVYDGSKNMAGKVQVVTGVTVNGLAETLLYSGAMANSADVSTATHLASLNLLDGGNGGKASNYRLPVLSPATAPLTITPKQLTALDVADYGLVTGVTYEKSYDATVNLPVTYRSGSESLRPAAEIASRHGLSASLIVGQSGQPLDITLVSATYDTAAAGVGKPLTLTYATDNPNFSIAPISAAQSESISYGNPTLGSWGGGEAYVWSGSGKTVYYKTLNHTNSGQRGELTHSSAYGTTTYYPTNTSAPLYAHTYSSSWSSVPGQPPLTQTLTFNQLMAQLETSMGIELYNRSVTTSNFVGNIDPARLLFLGTYRLAPKTYDGTTAGSINQLESWTLAPMPGITWNDPQDAGTVQLATAGASLVYSDSAVARSGDGSVVARSATISGLQLTGINAANYFIDNQTVFGVINPLPITVRALAANKTYGDADPALGVALGAGVLAPTDTLHDVIRNLGRVPGETAGTYAIRTEVASFGPKSANYDLTYVGGDLTIARRALTVTALAAGKTYGDADPAFSAAVTAGSLGSATVADSLADVTGVLTRQPGENAGVYGITLGAGVRASNYNITLVGPSPELRITPKPVIVRASGSKIYGETDPILTFSTNVPLIGTDSLSGALSRSPGETAGNYGFTVSNFSVNDGNGGANYNWQLVPGNFTIVRRALTVTALAAGKTYGDADPAFSAAVTGGSFAFADTLTDVVGPLTRPAGESVGSYALIPSGPGSKFANYDLTYVGGDLTIARRALTVTAAAAGKIYGDADPAFSAAVTGGSFAFADSLTDVTGVLTRQAGEDVGAYGIALGAGARAFNYDLTYVGGDLTVTPKSLRVVGLSVNNKVYDGTTSASLSNSGAILGNASNSGDGRFFAGDDVTLTVSSAGLALPSKNVGTYVLGNLPGLLLSGSSARNYRLDPISGTAVITPRPIVISGISASDKVYDASERAVVSVTNASGWIQGDDLRVSVTGAFTDKNVGPGKSVTLSSVYSGADAANYIITDQLTATASIRVKPLRVFGFGVQSKNADGTDTATITGTPVLQGGAVSDGDSRFYDNDAVSIAGSAVGRFASTAPSPSIPVEVSGLSLQGLDAANYSLMTVSATGSITSNQEFRPRFEQVSFPVQAAYVSPGIPQATVTVVMDSGLVSDLMPETPSRLILDPGLTNSLTPVLILNTDSSFGAISLPTKPLALPGQPFSLSLASVLGVPSVPEGLRVVLTTPDGNVPAWANFELDGGMLRGIAPASEASPSLLRVTATDRQSNVASFTLVAGAAAVGSPPKPSGFVAVNGVKPQVVTVGTLLSFKVPEGTFKHENSSEPLQFTATRADGSPLPSWMSFDPASQTFSGEPPAGEQGVLDVVVIATDSGQNKAQVQMKITVK